MLRFMTRRGRFLMWSGCGLMLAALLLGAAGLGLVWLGYDSNETPLLVLGGVLVAVGGLGAIVGMGTNWYGFAQVYLGLWQKNAEQREQSGLR